MGEAGPLDPDLRSDLGGGGEFPRPAHVAEGEAQDGELARREGAGTGGEGPWHLAPNAMLAVEFGIQRASVAQGIRVGPLPPIPLPG